MGVEAQVLPPILTEFAKRWDVDRVGVDVTHEDGMKRRVSAKFIFDNNGQDVGSAGGNLVAMAVRPTININAVHRAFVSERADGDAQPASPATNAVAVEGQDSARELTSVPAVQSKASSCALRAGPLPRACEAPAWWYHGSSSPLGYLCEVSGGVQGWCSDV